MFIVGALLAVAGCNAVAAARHGFVPDGRVHSGSAQKPTEPGRYRVGQQSEECRHFHWGVFHLMNSMKFKNGMRRSTARRTALALAIAAGVGLSGQVLAQATTGSVFGTAPVSAGETVRIVNNATGLTREVAVGSDGRYGANQLPVGDYTVSLMQGGNAVATK